MKLFLYDEKHENVIDELDLGKLNYKQEMFANDIIKFLEINNITSRYKDLVLAEKYQVTYDEDGNKEIMFE